MAQKQKMFGKTKHHNCFPPEADSDFDPVKTEDILQWRERLNERFGIGQGKLKPVEEPKEAAAG